MSGNNENDVKTRVEDTTSVLKNTRPGEAPSGARDLGNGQNPLHGASTARPADSAAASRPQRPAPQPAVDSLDAHRRASRMEIDALDTRISNLDRTIELEQQRLKESKEAVERSYHTRARLMHLRSAMLQFVMELESRNDS